MTSGGGPDGTKDNPSDELGGRPAPKKAWSKFTKDMLGNKTDFLDEMLKDYDVVDHGNGSLSFNGVLYTIPPELYVNTTGEALLPDGDANYTNNSVEFYGVVNINYEDFILSKFQRARPYSFQNLNHTKIVSTV